MLRRPTLGLAIASAAATFWFSAAIGCISVRRWKRAIFWLLTDWLWFAIAVAGAMSAHPRLMPGDELRDGLPDLAYKQPQYIPHAAVPPSLLPSWTTL